MDAADLNPDSHTVLSKPPTNSGLTHKLASPPVFG